MKELLLWEIMNKSQKQTRQRSCMQESKLATSVSKRATWNMCSRGALGNIKAERLKAKVVFVNFGIVVVSFWEWEVVCRNGKQGFHTGVFCVIFIIVHWCYVCDSEQRMCLTVNAKGQQTSKWRVLVYLSNLLAEVLETQLGGSPERGSLGWELGCT